MIYTQGVGSDDDSDRIATEAMAASEKWICKTVHMYTRTEYAAQEFVQLNQIMLLLLYMLIWLYILLL